MADAANWPAFGAGFPDILEVRHTSARVDIRLLAASDLEWFAGHFPGEPVLPGIIQTHWAVQLARAAFDIESQPERIKRLKFRQVVVPPQELELTLTREGPCEVQFAYSSDNGQHSQGRLVFPNGG
jgi:3-hydroxymyristoyl/3-hydroxydecanoyl-(acyl carrier protein) dehydratase